MANVVVVGAQWGDEGKGKIVDVLTPHADLVVRYGGGANAGHTLVVDGRKLVLHLLPSGVAHPEKRCLLGPGMVIDPDALQEELEACRILGLPVGPDRIGVSESAHVILPYHKLRDGLRERGSRALGTTRRGIGPCYEHKAARLGVQVWHLCDPAALREVIAGALESMAPELAAHGEPLPDLDGLVAWGLAHGERIARYLCDVPRALAEAEKVGQNLLLEGAQGSLLDLDHGTYPFVTSSSTVAGGACTGAGIGPTHVTAVVGILKAYLTRVGLGPMPTELDDALGERLRQAGGEFGATTGRPRRCGWLDLPALRRAVWVNGLTHLAVTKLDVLMGIAPLRRGIGYSLDGARIDEWPSLPGAVARLRPVYEDLPGFTESLRTARTLEDLPAGARAYLDGLSAAVGVPVSIVSVGPDRSETIIVENPFAKR